MIDVLNKGFVELVDFMGSDATVVNAARISFSKEVSEIGAADVKLIEYLAKNKHYSPFYHPQLQFKIRAPISVHRQWEKHRVGTTINTESTRYIEVHDDFYIPDIMRAQSESNKQGSAGPLDDSEPYNGPASLQGGWHQYMTRQEAAREHYIMACQDSYTCYQSMLKIGVAKEQAREVLPLCTYVSFVWTASLFAVHNFLKLRDHNHAQFEIREYAKAIRQIATDKFPISLSALGDYDAF